MQFLDEAKIYIQSGQGGDGCVAFRRERNVPHGGPNGGNGGRGGHVYARCVSGLNTLIDFRYQQHFKAKRGIHGMGQLRTGAKADDIYIDLPAGTQILSEDKSRLIADLTEPGQIIKLAHGGDGGFGNAHFKTSVNQAPRRFTKGAEGEGFWCWLRLKLLSDAGMVGLPNAGKSTFISAVTRAKPKIADYPFTTLVPKLGVAAIDEEEFVIADIPGLIAGASQGVGLGHQFLGHIERCGVLLHLIDVTQEEICGAYDIIQQELAAYQPELAVKPQLLALNKCDALSQQEIEHKRHLLASHSGKEVACISAAARHGLQDILRQLWHVIKVSRNGETEEDSIAR